MRPGQVIELTTENFDEVTLTAPQPILVDFWAPWCAPCRMMAQAVDTLAEVFAGRLTVGKVNVDRNAELAATYGVMSIPTLALLQNGQLIKTWVGTQPPQSLVRELANLLSHQATK